MRYYLFLLTFLLLGGSALAQGSAPLSPENTVLQLESQNRTALAAEGLIDPHWQAVAENQLSRVDLEEPQVRVYNGTTAIVTGVWKISGTHEGQPFETSRRFTHLWIQVGEGWKLFTQHLALEEP